MVILGFMFQISRKNGQFDARGTLAPLAPAKFFFKSDETHIYDRVFNYEQNEPKYGLLSWKSAEKNESSNELKLFS